ncbi:MAG: hypothetical protein K1W41_01800 [Lachnospiraceae bacterium]
MTNFDLDLKALDLDLSDFTLPEPDLKAPDLKALSPAEPDLKVQTRGIKKRKRRKKKMNLLDIIILIPVIGGIVMFYRKKKSQKEAQKAENATQDTPHDLANYNALRNAQASTPQHGVSIVSIYYDSAASYADMEKDGTNTGFDLNCETKVNDVLKSLKADGYSPMLNALSCVDRVIFYITY